MWHRLELHRLLLALQMGCLCSKAEPVPPDLRPLCGIWGGHLTTPDGTWQEMQLFLREDGTGRIVVVSCNANVRGRLFYFAFGSDSAKFSRYTPSTFMCTSGCNHPMLTFTVRRGEDGKLTPHIGGITLAPVQCFSNPTELHARAMEKVNATGGVGRATPSFGISMDGPGVSPAGLSDSVGLPGMVQNPALHVVHNPALHVQMVHRGGGL